MPRHASVILISDFFAPLPDIDRRLRALAARGVSGVLLQVVDPAEESLPFTVRTRFGGVEEDGDMLVPRVEAIRSEYARAFADHRAGLNDITRALGWRTMLHHTDHSPESALMALYSGKSGRTVQS